MDFTTLMGGEDGDGCGGQKPMVELQWYHVTIASTLILVNGTRLAMGVDPLRSPKEFIPALGMLLGNTMTGITLGLDQCLSQLSDNKEKIELYLSMGATRWEACRPVAVEAMRRAMMPTINQMSIIGLISIPGMMTGQLIAGASVMNAAKSQQIIMFLISGAAAFGTLSSVLIYFTPVISIMTKSKSPRRNSSNNRSPPSPKSNGNPNASPNASIGAAAAALHLATIGNTTPPTSPPPSPKRVKDNHPSTSNEVKSKVLSTLGEVKEISMEAHAETGVSNRKQSSVKSASLTTISTTISSSTSTTRGGRSNTLSPSVLSYTSNNLFSNLRLDQRTNENSNDNRNDIKGAESDTESESNYDSELDYSSSSSESSNSIHSTDDEDSEEEVDDDEDSEEEEEEKTKPHVQQNLATNDNIATRKTKQQKQQQKKQQQIQKEEIKNPIQQRHTPPQEEQQQREQQHQRTRSKSQSPVRQGKEPEKETVVLLADESAKTKWANWSVRTLWTLIMIGGFFACIAAGPLFVILLVVMVQSLVFKEVIYLAHVPSKEKKLPWFRVTNWYFLFSTNYFFYGESLIHYFQHVVFVDAFLLPFATHHRFISFTLYVIGFVFFVANLKKGHYRFQFSQFAWTHMTLLLVVCQSHFIINNIFEGLIWFFLPASLVISNDIFAYIFGFFFGKTPLIKLSPKKTVEGFVGGWVMTIVFGMLFATLFLRYPYMICPVKDLRATAFSGLTCELNPVFVPVKYYLKPWMVALVRHLGIRSNHVMIAPLQLHTAVMACFASLIAPFGGFFASGFKRAFKIKDFGHSIPGHGGMTDRMDCQFMMGLFSYMYYQSFIKTTALSVGVVLQSAINNLQGQEQMELFNHMRQYLIGQGLLDEESCLVVPPKEAWIK
ncbi:hypothetical protein BGZ79_010377 [Entomortierella chlamydospora]|nr:hypothetical protein BGZ79_010377 [Entomortierella chlamydospora]